jgi:hypothetical protein
MERIFKKWNASESSCIDRSLGGDGLASTGKTLALLVTRSRHVEFLV